MRQVEASLKRLRTDYLDLYMLHRWDPNVPLEETLEALDRLVQQGKTRTIGCSNYMAWQLCRGLWLSELKGWARFQAVQNGYSVVRRDIERELLPFCAYAKVGLVTYSPLGAGFLTGKYFRDGAVPPGTRFDVLPGHQTIYFDDARWSVMEGLRAKADELGLPMAQLALAWVITQSGITSVLIGARDIAHIDNAFAAEGWGISGDLRDELSALWPVPVATDAALM
jgi:aryl-alcohol dehydrogenase-like predicted oxidoreductase